MNILNTKVKWKSVLISGVVLLIVGFGISVFNDCYEVELITRFMLAIMSVECLALGFFLINIIFDYKKRIVQVGGVVTNIILGIGALNIFKEKAINFINILFMMCVLMIIYYIVERFIIILCSFLLYQLVSLLGGAVVVVAVVNYFNLSENATLYIWLITTFVIYLSMGVKVNKFIAGKIGISGNIEFSYEILRNNLLFIGAGVFMLVNIYFYNNGEDKSYELINTVFLTYSALVAIEWTKIIDWDRCKNLKQKLIEKVKKGI